MGIQRMQTLSCTHPIKLQFLWDQEKYHLKVLAQTIPLMLSIDYFQNKTLINFDLKYQVLIQKIDFFLKSKL